MSRTARESQPGRPTLPRYQSASEAALYLWDYFSISNAPTQREDRLWRRIETATIRIQESVPPLAEGHVASVRFANARRVRRAAREISRRIPLLESVPERWVSDVVEYFTALADSVIAETRDARIAGVTVHAQP